MTYGVKVFALTKSSKEKLSRYDRYFLSLLTKFASNKNCHKVSRKKLLGGRTIGKKIKAYRIRFWTHVLRRPSNHLLQQALEFRAPYKKIGRPCFTWNTPLEQDFGSTGISKDVWKQSYNNKEKIKQMTDDFLDIENALISDLDEDSDNGSTIMS